MDPFRRSALVVEDDPRVRDAVALLLRSAAWKLSLAPTAAEALRQFDADRPDVCLVDLGLPDLEGVALIRALLARRSDVPIVVLTIAISKADILGALRAGAVGYLLKEDVGSRLVAALDEACAGGAPMSRRVAQMVLEELRSPGGSGKPSTRSEGRTNQAMPSLTAREIEVVESLSRGLSYSDVAKCLDISTNTVRAHVRSIYEKLAVATKTEAVLEAMRLGMIRPSA